MTFLQPIADLLSGKYPWLITVLALIGAVRVPLKFFSEGIQARMTARMVAAAASCDPQDDRDWDALLTSRRYRFITFVLDLLFSYKLPMYADFVRLQNQTSEAKMKMNL
jgi:hypothetical protein